MLKYTAILTLMFIGICASLSCDSCGSECAPACGSKRFRFCCFNYLRKKRDPDMIQIWPKDNRVFTLDIQKSKPVFIDELGQWKLSHNVIRI